MTKAKLLSIAERNVRKAYKALEQNRNRPGITKEERENLMDNRVYTLYIRELIRNYVKD